MSNNLPDPATQVQLGDLVTVKTPDGYTDVATVVVWVGRELLRMVVIIATDNVKAVIND